MVRLRIIEILEQKSKSKYWLNKQMGMHYVSFKKMIENQTNSIRFDTLYKLCKVLDVSIDELFELTDDDK